MKILQPPRMNSAGLVFIKREFQKLCSDPDGWYKLVGIRTQYLFDGFQNERLVKTLNDGSKIIRIQISNLDSYIVCFERISQDDNVSMKRHIFPADERIYLQDCLGRIVSMQTAEEYWRSIAFEAKIELMTRTKTLEPWWQLPKIQQPEENELAALPVLVEDEATPFISVKTHFFAKKLNLTNYADFKIPHTEEPVVEASNHVVPRFSDFRKMPMLCKKRLIESEKMFKNFSSNMKFQASILFKKKTRNKMKGKFLDNMRVE